MSEIEEGRCGTCREIKQLNRKYFHYDVDCECCSGKHHFVIVRHCNVCKPREPESITVTLKLKPVET